VTDPQTGVTVKERRYAKDFVDADKAARTKLLDDKNIKLQALGAGSDWSAFLQHMGIASVHLGYGGEDPAGVYHSVYDSYDHFTKFGDPGFPYGIALAKTAGRFTMRIANADILPFDLNSFYKTVAEYTTEVKTLLENSRSETELQNKMINDKLFAVANDPIKKLVIPKPKEVVPFLNFSGFENSLAQLKLNAEDLQKLYKDANSLPSQAQAQLNEILFKVERSLIQPEGLPRRPWYKHQVYAPGFYTGYGVKTLPAIREAIEQRNWKEAQGSIDIATKTILAYNAEVQQAVNLLKKTF
jgi:N-acetylated-alpha-linked acidic dipeptidase